MDVKKSWLFNSSSSELTFFTKSEIVADIQSNFDYRRNNSTEGESVTIGGASENVLIQHYTNPLNADRIDSKIHVANSSALELGSYVVRDSATWLVISKPDSVSGAYKSAQIMECNYTLKFQNQTTGAIISRPCIFEKSTGDAIKEGNVLSVGNQQYIVKLPLDSETELLRVDRRLLVDTTTTKPNAYFISNRDAVSGYGGILNLTLTQDEFNADTDNVTLMVANYFTPPSPAPEDQAYCVITYAGKPELKIGGSAKQFVGKFYDKNGDEVTISGTWKLNISSEYTPFITSIISGNTISIKVANELSLLGITVILKLEGEDEEAKYHTELSISVVGLV